MQDFSIVRVGKSDLVFNGELIGQSGGAKPRVKIYRTKAAKYIGEISVDAQRSDADHFDKPTDLVGWLSKHLNSITIEAQTAIEAAAKQDETFKAFWTEKVE